MRLRLRYLMEAALLFLTVGGLLVGPLERVRASHGCCIRIGSWGGADADALNEVLWTPYAEKFGTGVKPEVYKEGAFFGPEAQDLLKGLKLDVAMMEKGAVQALCDAGALNTIDFDALGGAGRFLPGAVQKCGVGVAVRSLMIGYDPGKVEEPGNWADLFDADGYPGPRAMVRTPVGNLEIALLADGVEPTQIYSTLATEEGIERAFQKLSEIKNDVIWTEGSQESMARLATGEAAYGVLRSDMFANAVLEQGLSLKPVWNGQLYWINFWVIPKSAPWPDHAAEFLAFANGGDRQAALSQSLFSGPVVNEAGEFLDSDFMANLPTAMEGFDLRGEVPLEIDGRFWAENFDSLRDRFEDWLAR